MRQSIHGILLLDKPENMTSNGALQRVKRLFNAKKAGHTGSLDPIATGMLPICFGEATKFSQFLLESNKSYVVTAKLGIQTTTGDREGEPVAIKPVQGITAEQIAAVLTKFTGTIEQIPPMFSALKVNGKPLYELARKGIEVERQPRRITIFSIELCDAKDDQFSIEVHCSKGTYVRTLIEDIGHALGSCAHVIELRRPTVTPYHNSIMYTLPELEKVALTSGAERLKDYLLPVETAVEIFPAITLNTAAAFYVRMGQPVRTSLPLQTSLVRLLSEDAQFIGMGEVMADGRIRPHRLVEQFPQT